MKDASGDEWELYVSRAAPPRELAGPRGQVQKIFGPFEFGCLGLLFAPVLLAYYGLIKFVVAPGLRLFGSSVRGRATGRVRIEALCFYGTRRSRYWTTTGDQRDRVLDEIAEGLVSGRIPNPEGATYHGELER